MPLDQTNFPNHHALEGLNKVRSLIGREDQWCKQQLQSHDGRRCMLGAMLEAGAAVELKDPIMKAIKQVTGRPFIRIEMFNDHPLTTHALVLRVLDRAETNIILGDYAPALPGARRWYHRLFRMVPA